MTLRGGLLSEIQRVQRSGGVGPQWPEHSSNLSYSAIWVIIWEEIRKFFLGG